MLHRFYQVSTNFDQHLPIISRSANNEKLNNFSFRKSVGITCEHLVYGYTSRKNLQMANKTLFIPNEIKQMCFNYFVGNFLSSIYDDTLSRFNEKAQIEFIQSSFQLLCPGTIKQSTQKLLLVHFIHLAHICAGPAGQCHQNRHHTDWYTNLFDLMQKFNKSGYNHCIKIKNQAYYRNVYLSYLSSLAEITNFFDILNRTALSEEECPRCERSICIRENNATFASLTQEYEIYGEIEKIKIYRFNEDPHFNLFKKQKIAIIRFKKKPWHAVYSSKFILSVRSIDYKQSIIDIAWENANDISLELICRLISQHNIFYKIYKTKPLFCLRMPDYTPRVVTKFKDKLEMNSLRKLLIPLVLRKHAETKIVDDPSHYISLLLSNDISNERLNLGWLWLQKEVEYGLLNTNSNICLDNIFLQSVVSNILSKLQTISIPTKREYAFELLHLLFERTKLDISFKINNFERFSEIIVSELLRSAKYGFVGWKILDIEIDKMFNNSNIKKKQYEYFDEWIS
eukprot:410043_1